MSTFTNKTVFLTGGGSGIGRAMAKLWASRGAKVCIADINIDAAQKVAKECGSNAVAVSVDVRDAAAMKSSIEAFASEHGRLDYTFLIMPGLA